MTNNLNIKKPQFKNLRCLDFIEVLDYLEGIGFKGIKDRMWSFFLNDIKNDSYFDCYIPTEEEQEDDYEISDFKDLGPYLPIRS